MLREIDMQAADLRGKPDEAPRAFKECLGFGLEKGF